MNNNDSVSYLLSRGAQKISENDTDVTFRCIFCGHDTLGVSNINGTFQCWRKNKCGKTGNIITFKKFYNDFKSCTQQAESKSSKPKTKPATSISEIVANIKDEDKTPIKNYLKKRGITGECFKRHCSQMYLMPAYLGGSILFPVYKDGKRISLSYKPLNGERGTNLSGHPMKGGQWPFFKPKKKKCILVESCLNALTLRQTSLAKSYSIIATFSSVNLPDILTVFNEIVLYVDNDLASVKWAQKIKNTYPDKKVRRIVWPEGTPESYDVNDLLQDKGEAFERELEKLEIIEIEVSEEISIIDVNNALYRNEDGDAALYRKLFKNRFVFDHDYKQWFVWKKNFWEEDMLNETLAKTSDLVELYESLKTSHENILNSTEKNIQTIEKTNEQTKILIAERKKLKEKCAGLSGEELTLIKAEIAQKTKELLVLKSKKESIKENYNDLKKRAKKTREKISAVSKRIQAIQKLDRKKHVLTLASSGIDSLGITTEVWDIEPSVLACKNGIIDLKTGAFRKGQPEDYIKTYVPTEYHKDAPCLGWKKFLNEVFLNDKELTSFMQRLLGYSMLGYVPEHILPIFWGVGRNGKGTLFETLFHVLGTIAAPIQAEMLLKQKFSRSSDAPSPSILSLKGKRIAVASEVNEGRSFDLSKVKMLSGGDTLKGRAPYGERPIGFAPSHILFLQTNVKPHADIDDFAFWNRAMLVPFEVSFVDNPEEEASKNPDRAAQMFQKRDPGLRMRLMQESSGILSWLIEGCLQYQEKGLCIPVKVKAATENYKDDEDLITSFANECCTKTQSSDRQRASQLYSGYRAWCEKNSIKPFSGKIFGKKMSKKFIKGQDRYGMYYEGILLKEEYVVVEDFEN